MFLTKKQWKKEKNAMNKFSLNKPQCIQHGIYSKNIKKNKIRHLCTPKTAKFTLIRLTISEISPLLYIIFIIWNSISGLDTRYHFRFNISCGVAVMMRGQQKKNQVIFNGRG